MQGAASLVQPSSEPRIFPLGCDHLAAERPGMGRGIRVVRGGGRRLRRRNEVARPRFR